VASRKLLRGPQGGPRARLRNPEAIEALKQALKRNPEAIEALKQAQLRH